MKHEMMIWLRYALVGLCNSIVGLGLIAILMHGFRWTHTSATLLGNVTGLLFSYGCNRYFTFRDQGKMRRSLLRFAAVSLFSYMIAYVLLHDPLDKVITLTLSSEQEAWKEDAVILLEASIYTITSFLLRRLYTFNSTNKLSIVETQSDPQ